MRGLWYVLHRTSDYQFLQHPQLWLIPVALSVLLAAYLNEKEFERRSDGGDQISRARLRSTLRRRADIFINGVANSPWLPLILGAFSLAGVFAGIIFRIRGLLLLGSVFPVALDHHHDLVRIGQPGLDCAVVRRRHRHRRDDHFHVCVVREETRAR
jgi:hypothetical protein